MSQIIAKSKIVFNSDNWSYLFSVFFSLQMTPDLTEHRIFQPKQSVLSFESCGSQKPWAERAVVDGKAG